MSAMTAERRITRRKGDYYSYPVAANTKIYAGSLLVMAGGYVRPATYATPSQVVGIADETADNSGGAAGDISLQVKRGVFLLNNAASPNAVDRTMFGAAILVLDDQTIAKPGTSGGVAHTGYALHDVDDDGVWISI